MDKDIKQKWVAALRSGEYEQLREELCSTLSPKCFCCIGVLALLNDIVSIDGKILDESKVFCGELQPNALAIFGLPFREQENLIHMNDIEEKSFSEIADYIEVNL